MRLSKFVKVMGAVTVLALTYIHMQMQIIDLAYRGNGKEQRIKGLVEENGSTTYKILTLKSASHLGGAMFDQDSGMQFADAHDIVQVAASENFLTEHLSDEQPKPTAGAKPVLSLLSFGVEAEAKTAD